MAASREQRHGERRRGEGSRRDAGDRRSEPAGTGLLGTELVTAARLAGAPPWAVPDRAGSPRMITSLQRTAGNHATVAYLAGRRAGSPVVLSGERVVQREEDGGGGGDEDGSLGLDTMLDEGGREQSEDDGPTDLAGLEGLDEFSVTGRWPRGTGRPMPEWMRPQPLARDPRTRRAPGKPSFVRANARHARRVDRIRRSPRRHEPGRAFGGRTAEPDFARANRRHAMRTSHVRTASAGRAKGMRARHDPGA